ncbi:MAG: site-specific DNA-methyltransferase, partial [Ignavibacteriae bacterium]|nr:site-specific DNA-methyltransferase [Ignavibacteriota bacterium]
IIKGNNLLTLTTLLPVYRGKIKLIYLDPPFNTNSSANTFSYNNSFNHSTWLSFMRNRLIAAKQLLSEDGILVTAIDHYELFYLGVLADEIFARDNRMGVISVIHNPGGRQDETFFPTAHENMLFYAKNILNVKLNRLPATKEKLAEYKLTDKFGRYKLRGFRRSGNNSLRSQRPGLFYPIYYDPLSDQFALDSVNKHMVKLLPIDKDGVERCWRWSSERFILNIEKYIEIKKTKDEYTIYIKERESDYEGEKAKTICHKPYYSGQTGTNELKNDFQEKVFSYPKSPYLIKDIIHICTNDGDIILDCFGGSGTTAKAVTQLNQENNGNRKFILCEQMNYIDKVTIKRIEKNLSSNHTFCYAELTKLNGKYIDEINKSNSTKDLIRIWQSIKKGGFLSIKVDPKEFDKNVSNFEKLNLEDQKKFLIKVLDKNHLYVNYSEINDKDYGIIDEDKRLNKQFYSLK